MKIVAVCGPKSLNCNGQLSKSSTVKKLGPKQADKLAESIKPLGPFQAFYCSRLTGPLGIASILATRLNLDFQTIPGLDWPLTSVGNTEPDGDGHRVIPIWWGRGPALNAIKAIYEQELNWSDSSNEIRTVQFKVLVVSDATLITTLREIARREFKEEVLTDPLYSKPCTLVFNFDGQTLSAA